MSFIHSGVLESESRRLIEQQLSTDLTLWLSDWLGANAKANLADLKFHYSEALFHPPKIWAAVESQELEPITTKADLVCAVFAADVKAYTDALLNLDKSSELNQQDQALVQKLATQSLSALSEGLNSFADGSDTTTPPVVVAELTINDSPFYFYLSTEYVQFFQQKVAQAHPLKTQTLEQVLSPEQVQVNVNIATQTLSFNDLCQLKKGDVIPLQQQLADPIAITIKGANTSSGYLVNKDNNKAIYLTGKHNEI